jgi:hypothetical protein
MIQAERGAGVHRSICRKNIGGAPCLITDHAPDGSLAGPLNKGFLDSALLNECPAWRGILAKRHLGTKELLQASDTVAQAISQQAMPPQQDRFRMQALYHIAPNVQGGE